MVLWTAKEHRRSEGMPVLSLCVYGFLQLVEKGTKLVLEQVVTTIASVADTSEEQFVAYYDRLMPCLKYIIQNANTEELKMLRGKAIECVSLIGLAVGAEKVSWLDKLRSKDLIVLNEVFVPPIA